MRCCEFRPLNSTRLGDPQRSSSPSPPGPDCAESLEVRRGCACPLHLRSADTRRRRSFSDGTQPSRGAEWGRRSSPVSLGAHALLGPGTRLRGRCPSRLPAVPRPSRAPARSAARLWSARGSPHHIPGCPRIGTALLKLTQIPNAGVFWRRLNVLPCRESASAKWLLGRLPLTVLATSIASPRRGPAPADLVIQASSQAVNGTQPAPQPRRIRLPRGDHGSPAEGGRRTPLLLPSEATLTSTWPTLLNSGADAWILSLDLPRPGLNSRRSAARCAPRAP